MTLVLTGKRQVVVEFIENKIAENQIPSGEKLDTESGIAKALGITRATVREATSYLVEKGIIYRVNGSGLYVGSANKQHQDDFQVISPFDHQAEQAGQSAIRKVLSIDIIDVPSVQIAHALRIDTNDKVYCLERLVSFGYMPVSYEKVHIPTSVCELDEINQLEESKYSHMEQITGKKVQLREQAISAFNLNDSKQAALLKVDEGQAMIELRELVSFDDGTPFEYTVAVINSDLFNIHQVLRR
ncbi:MAG TPA: GntR family transcriptional regulator [Vibrio sp.]|nr:GntR family transcriptional regulator [Vibrio sp.]